MEPDHARAVGGVFEMADHGIAHLGLQSLKVVCLGEDGRAQCARQVAAFWRLFDYEDDLVHVMTSQEEGPASHCTLRASCPGTPRLAPVWAADAPARVYTSAMIEGTAQAKGDARTGGPRVDGSGRRILALLDYDGTMTTRECNEIALQPLVGD